LYERLFVNSNYFSIEQITPGNSSCTSFSTLLENPMSDAKFVIKLDNGRGQSEYFLSWSVRAQACDQVTARKFTSEEAAVALAASCERCASAFSGVFYDDDRGCWTLTATVVPLCN
jgi:hypothetical protein